MKTITVRANEISQPVYAGAGSRITLTGSGYVEWAAVEKLQDALNGVAWQTWPAGSTAGYRDTDRGMAIRVVGTGDCTVTVEEGKADRANENAYWQGVGDNATVVTNTLTGGSDLYAAGQLLDGASVFSAPSTIVGSDARDVDDDLEIRTTTPAAIWYIDPRIAPGDESDAYLGPFGVGKRRDSWGDVTWAAGGVYLQARGSTYVGAVTVGASGNSGAPIKISSYGAGRRPIIDANGATTGAVYADGKDWFEVSGFELVGATGFPAAGVHTKGCSNVRIRRNYSRGNEYGIRFDNAGSTAIGGVEIFGNTLEDSDQQGIIVVTGTASGGRIDGVVIDSNTVVNSGAVVVGGAGIHLSTRLASTDAYDASRAIHNATITNNLVAGASGYGVMCRYVSAGLVAGNDVSGAGSTLAADTHGIWFGGCKDVVAEYNHVHNNFAWVGGTMGSGVGIYIDQGATSGTTNHESSNITVRYNKIYDQAQTPHLGTHSGAAIYVYRSRNVSIYGNDIRRCKNGIAVRGATTLNSHDVDIHNNTLLDIAEIAIPVGNLSSDVSLRNNIVVGAGIAGYWAESGASAVVNVARSHNVAYQCTVPWASGPLTAIGPASAGTGDTVDSPALTSAGRATSSTPYGVGVGLETDILRRVRASPPRAGAYE